MISQLIKKNLTALAALGLTASALGAHAQTPITVFNFNDASTTGTNAANAALLFSVDRGNGSLTSSFAAANVVSFTGTTLNADASDPAGAALALQGGTNEVNNGGYLQLNSSTAGYDDIVVSFAAQATATGFKSDQFQYSTDGTNWTDFGSVFTPGPSSPGFTSASATLAEYGQSFDLSGITGLNNDPNAAFRLVLNGASSAAGNIRLDNLIVRGTAVAPAPEPSSVAGIAVGAGALGLIVARRRKAARIS